MTESKADLRRRLAVYRSKWKPKPGWIKVGAELASVQTEGISTRAGVGGRRGRKRRRAEVKAWWRTAKAGLLKMAARA